MQRRHFLQRLGALVMMWLGFSACGRNENTSAASAAQGNPSIGKLDKPLTEWRTLLPPQAYAVLFEEATSARFPVR